MNHLTCGCCSNGCTCVHHADIPNGRNVQACAIHSVMPYAPLDKTFRWDAGSQNYIRVPVVKETSR